MPPVLPLHPAMYDHRYIVSLARASQSDVDLILNCLHQSSVSKVQ